MSLWTLLGIALALAMDAFAVSVASGVALKRIRIRHALTIAGFFGAFQAIMPLLGWLGGLTFKNMVSGFDHWLAFGLLSFIGCKMIYESFKIESVEKKTNPLDIYVLFVLSVATSLDALATGFSFALLGVSIVTPAIVIGLVTFATSFAGVFIGEKSGHFFEKRIEIVGGLILIGIGVRILMSHV
jgi:putative Mn2+ efflux pump MntP